jgi:hypothetical protein
MRSDPSVQHGLDCTTKMRTAERLRDASAVAAPRTRAVRSLARMTAPTAASVVPTTSARPSSPAGYLFHPLVDLLCLGGASLLVLPLMHFVSEAALPSLVLTSLFLADVINHPHFAHSYVLFYRGFGAKLTPGTLTPGLRARYFVAGVVVPIALMGFLLAALFGGEARVLGYGGNLMVFLVGWHYAKQGYGMLILDSVLKRRFFVERDKTIFRWNGYACWILYWLFANWYLSESEMWGLSYYAFTVPMPALYVVGAIAAATSGATLYVLVKKAMTGRDALPRTGVVVYLVTVYLWLFGRLDPGVLVFIPVFHSLQYLIVVWRYELNRANNVGEREPRRRLLSVILLATLMGYLGFWAIPRFLDDRVGFDHAALGATPFLFVFWIFINVHHYFVDNVIWRSENPDTKAHLFAAKRA